MSMVGPKWIALLSALLLIDISTAGTPAPEQFFHSQIVDHIDPDGPYGGETYAHRYYTWNASFAGPGSPIFMIMGGEGHISPETGLYYPFITHHLAPKFGAYVLQPEHRFYGKSQPLFHRRDSPFSSRRYKHDQREELFTSEQALHDYMNLLTHTQTELGCSLDRTSDLYCPVITVGGSYPGFLSALARVMFPNKVDIAYSASAPMLFYAQKVEQEAYYDHITKVANETRAGCAEDVRKALFEVQVKIMRDEFDNDDLGICEYSIPDYIEFEEQLVNELMMVVGYTFANDNMANYPPGNETRLYKTCEIFACTKSSSLEKVKNFLLARLAKGKTCWDMSAQLPTGDNATITSGDWSGVGTGADGESWDFQTCTREVEHIGFSEWSMFPDRPWSMDWLKDHCMTRFGVVPDPHGMVRQWGFDKLAENKVRRIVFTNGLKDGWSVGGFKSDLSESLPVINFPNGAHHSDLTGKGPSDADSEDIQEGFKTVSGIIEKWLNEVKSDSSTTRRVLRAAV
ncbi:unnamed protein product [Cylindrotheca closterium]|uniref:Uncharacterized protein n=1 Tax=Cylindrotheca closterium TaxID=2856 RepID=A0AAD2CDH0_9STRA|nr:unnamed protein product [Cylindrotheca closterium]